MPELKTKPLASFTEPPSIPYFGLGFELRALVEHSRRMSLRQVTAQDSSAPAREPVEQKS